MASIAGSNAKNAICGVLLALSLVFCFREGWVRAPSAMDFFTYYAPARVWLSGENPYDRGTYTQRVAELFPTNKVGETACPLLPSALTAFVPLALLPPDLATRTMWLITFAALLSSLFAMRELWARDWSEAEQWVVAAVLAQSRLIQSVAYRGQPSLLILAVVLCALIASRRGKYAWAGAAAAFTSSKFTLLLPLLAFWAWQRNWKPILWTAIIGSALALPPLFTIGPSTLVKGFLDSVAFIADYNYNADAYHLTTLRVILTLLPGTRSIPGLASVVLLGALAVALLWRRSSAVEGEVGPWMFAGLTTLGMLGVYHRVYDAVLLFPVAVMVWDRLRTPLGRRQRPVLVLALAVVLLLFVFSPQSVAKRAAEWLSGHPLLAFLEPVNAWLCLAMLAAIVLLLRGLPRDPGAGTLRRTV